MKSFLILGLSCLFIFLIELSVGIGLDRHGYHYTLMGIATFAFSMAGFFEYRLKVAEKPKTST